MQLAEQKYLSLLLEDLETECHALNSYLRHHSSPGKAELFLTQSPQYKELLSSAFTPTHDDLVFWANTPYQQNPKYPEQKIHPSASGHLLRSKSEVFIDMALYTRKIPFQNYNSIPPTESFRPFS